MVSPYRCWILTLGILECWPYLEIIFTKVIKLKWGRYGDLILRDWCPYKEEIWTQTYMQGEDHVKEEAETEDVQMRDTNGGQ